MARASLPTSPFFVLGGMLLAGILTAATAGAQPASVGETFVRMVEQTESAEAALIDFRHDLHKHPEVSGSEVRTSRLVAERLADLGFEVETKIGGHGVVGLLEGSGPGPVVAFRADMDAVRSVARDPAPYRALIPGVRHICGHDIHTSVGIALAEAFSATREGWPGTVLLIFQPAEERGTGAKAMLADGAFDAVTPHAIFALHTAPYDVGEVATVAGGMMSGRASVEVTLHGSAGLEEAAIQVRSALQDIGTLSPQRAGEVAPRGFVLVQMVPRTIHDPVRREAVVRGQIMTAGLRDRSIAKESALAALERLDIPGVSLKIEYDERNLEGVINDSALVSLSNQAIQRMASDIEVLKVRGAVPAFSEDFGSFQAIVPGVMYFLGVNNPETGAVGMPHTPDYVADDAAILVGARAVLAAMLERLTAM